MSEQSRVMASAIAGALIGAAVGFLFFTDRGRGYRERLEPAMDDLRKEFDKFQRTMEKVGEMATEGVRLMENFNNGRGESKIPTGRVSH